MPQAALLILWRPCQALWRVPPLLHARHESLTEDMPAVQVNKKTAPELLKAWRTNSKANPVDVYIHDKRVVHMRNWLCKVHCCYSCTAAACMPSDQQV